MAFLALGINHKTASVDVRERVAFTPEQLVEALQQLCRLTDSREAAILSTCNRSELYIEQDHLSADVILSWRAITGPSGRQFWGKNTYISCYYGQSAHQCCC